MTKINYQPKTSLLVVGRKKLPKEISFIWTVIKHLQELTSMKIEHELRLVNAEVIHQSKTSQVFFSIISKILAKSNKHAI